jgi:hypothetical protein
MRYAVLLLAAIVSAAIAAPPPVPPKAPPKAPAKAASAPASKPAYKPTSRYANTTLDLVAELADALVTATGTTDQIASHIGPIAYRIQQQYAADGYSVAPVRNVRHQLIFTHPDTEAELSFCFTAKIDTADRDNAVKILRLWLAKTDK